MGQRGNGSQTHFNSHAHVERDIAIELQYDMTVDFNSHAHVERDYANR